MQTFIYFLIQQNRITWLKYGYTGASIVLFNISVLNNLKIIIYKCLSFIS